MNQFAKGKKSKSQKPQKVSIVYSVSSGYEIYIIAHFIKSQMDIEKE